MRFMRIQLWVAAVLSIVLTVAPAPSAQDFHGCPPQGQGGDPALNRLKNRTEEPAQLEPMHFQDVVNLDVPEGVSKKHRDKWTQATRDAVSVHERRAVVVVGYLLKVKLEGPESPNCHSDEEPERDFHLWLANSDDDDDKADAVVVEVTPRIRARHPAWSRKNLGKFVKQKSKVRISGWLMLDPEHPDQVGKTRATVWEIHPIMKIEVWSGKKWREL